VVARRAHNPKVTGSSPVSATLQTKTALALDARRFLRVLAPLLRQFLRQFGRASCARGITARRFLLLTSFARPMPAKMLPPLQLPYKHLALVDTGPRWYIKYYYRNPSGRFVRFREYGELATIADLGMRRAAALALLQSMRDALASGVLNPFARAALTDPLAKLALMPALWALHEAHAPRVKPRTCAAYKDYLKRLQRFLESEKLLEVSPAQFTPQLARRFTAWLTATGLSNTTHNNTVVGLRIAWNWLLARELVAHRPFASIKLLGTTEGRHVPLESTAQAACWAYVSLHDRSLKLAMLLIYQCFLRESEICALTLGQVDLFSRTLTLAGTGSKNRKTQAVALTPQVCEELGYHLASPSPLPATYYLFGRHQLTRAATGGTRKTGSTSKAGPIRPGPHPIHPHRLYERHKRMLEKLDLAGQTTLYAWKHTGAAAASEVMTPYELQRQLRHSHAGITQRYLAWLGKDAPSAFMDWVPSAPTKGQHHSPTNARKKADG